VVGAGVEILYHRGAVVDIYEKIFYHGAAVVIFIITALWLHFFRIRRYDNLFYSYSAMVEICSHHGMMFMFIL
jgi:hypothetical protein